MCGIFGYDVRRYQMTRDQRIAMSALLCALNDQRGGESWGYYDITNDLIHKGLGDIANVSTKVGKNMYFLGHTRKATTGEVIAENSHPFDIGNIIGAHNGMVMNHEMLNVKYDRNCIVDSEHIFHHINSGLPLDDIRGYGAIEWINKNEPGRVYLCRLGGGELSVFSFGKKKTNRGVVWSSDDDHIRAALSAADIHNFTEYEIKTGVVYFVEKGVLYKTDKTYELASGGYSGSLNQYGWYDPSEDDDTEVKYKDYSALARHMDDKEERRWAEIFRLADERKRKVEESELDAEFEHTHALNGDDIESNVGKSDVTEEDIDEVMKEWYLSCGGDPAEFDPDSYHPSVMKEINPTK